MDVKDAIEQRRSIKYFDPAHVMPSGTVTDLLDSTLLSPTAFNIQNWRFVNVCDAEMRAEIRKAAWDQPQVTDASLLLVLCMDLMAWNRDPARYWRNAPAEIAEEFVPEIKSFYRDDEELQRDEGMRSCGIASMTLMLRAKELGYDSCAMDGFDFKRVAHLIRLPEDHEICMMVAIGKPLRDPWPRGGQLSRNEVCFTDHF